MKIVGEATLVAPVEKVWDALLDPSVLVATIPGCERLEETGENAYAMTVTAGVAAVRGTYAGTCELRDLEPHRSLVLAAQGAGTPGTIAADVSVSFDDNGDGTTTLHYDADTVVGGMIGGVGQRMLTSVSRRMATEFFTNVEREIAQGVPGVAPPVDASTVSEQSAGRSAGEPAPASVAAGGGAVFTAAAQAPGSRDDFVKGVMVGAGLVLSGVVAGALLGRRR
ncbi:carbon monoxide dehydrogenase subunit G [Nocardioides sp. JQ2195]|uniref:SRPBCC family protein n=1 Tax=Nocardioides sp. JQ2195 TaxID=2592334 RepID=UPI00143E2F82|nr:carbon monoxide dehydrogenase subunit G [Nocardioides sp. JQ2195]QIX27627.1 carbon monoxide dehydrogenase subunit G [Nocardioides sp. JQ2195]